MYNCYLEIVQKRHEARKIFLPRLGFIIPNKPNVDQVERAIVAFDIAKSVERIKYPLSKDFVKDRTEKELLAYIKTHPFSGGAPNYSYLVYNAAMATTAAPV